VWCCTLPLFRIERASHKPETASVRWQKITLIGVGLLGGSLGLALKHRRLAGNITGYVRRPASIRECKASGAVDVATLDLHEAVVGADLIVFCTPLAQMRPLAQQMVSSVKPGTIITDVGSVKSSVVAELEPLFAKVGAFFIGSHPMAGGEQMGVSAARADLFEQAVCVVTPTKKKSSRMILKVEGLWKEVGAKVLRLSPGEHDKLVGRSSHLPHVLAAILVQSVLNSKTTKEQRLLCANGFRDSTRVASGSPEMWRDIVLANRQNLIASMEGFAGNLSKVCDLLKSGDPEEITQFFACSKEKRDQWISRFGGTSSE
jgi:prephenate dehydrogenase